MKARVKTFLNIRTRRPAILPDNNPNDLFFSPGDVIEIMEAVEGERYKDNTTWFRLDDGTFVWSGGVEDTHITTADGSAKTLLKAPIKKWQFDSAKMSWAHDSAANGGLGIVDLWNEMGVRGEGINVLVLDTGISANRADFIDQNSVSNIKGLDFVRNINGINDAIDINGHGTNSAAIIAATGKQNVYGIAPDINLYIIKIGGNLFASIENLKNGLQLAISNEWKPDIISISFCFSNDNLALAALLSTSFPNSIILSSLKHPNNSNKLNIDVNQFPASYDNVIAVAAIDNNRNVISPCNFVENKICWSVPGANILTLNASGNKTQANQTSIATPLAAGIFALFMSYLKKNNIPATSTNISKLKKLILDKDINAIKVFKDDTEIEINVCICNPFAAFRQIPAVFQV